LFATVLMLLIPVPAMVLDVMLALQIGLSLLVLLIVVYVKDPPEFSGFPTLLLGLTLFRLALNICSTRLILTKGTGGNVIESFGHFVIQGNYIVGFVVFIILIVINFVVITKGAGRIAEVSARFTLDALPGKQMAIDAELNAGIIDEQTATARRRRFRRKPTSTERWTVRPSSSAVTRSRAFSSHWSISSAVSPSASSRWACRWARPPPSSRCCRSVTAWSRRSQR
jgi:flagellar biosynthesis protein FlhA